MKKTLTFLALILTVSLYANAQTAEEYLEYLDNVLSKYKLGDFSGAIQDCNKAIELNPNHADAYNNRGASKLNLGDYMGAIQDCNKAIELNPNFAEAYYNRGYSKYNLGDYMGAIQDCNKAIELNPNFAEAYYNRGKMAQKRDRAERAQRGILPANKRQYAERKRGMGHL